MNKLLLITLVAALVFVACTQAETDGTQTYTVALTTASEIPAITSPSEGSGSISLTLNQSKKELSATGSYSNLTGAATAAHIHGPASKTETGGVIVALNVTESDTVGTGTLGLEATTLTDEQITDLKAGNYYINVHTEANAPGELRGQIE